MQVEKKIKIKKINTSTKVNKKMFWLKFYKTIIYIEFSQNSAMKSLLYMCLHYSITLIDDTIIG